MAKTTTQRITLVALLASLSTVIKFLSLITTNPQGGRLTFYEIPIIIAGSLFGPIYGIITGFASDVGFMVMYGSGPNLHTISSMQWGLLAGILLYKQKITIKNLLMVVLLGSITEFFVSGFAVYLFNFGSDPEVTFLIFLATSTLRTIILVIKWPIQVYLLRLLYLRVLEVYDTPKMKKSVSPVLE